ncbi:MAG: PDZ domain-containing protein [Deltaproteobacteria bacterium]|nr:PDZ domain-containing protein [Deltaproteobacteria bacterium]
MRRRRAEIFLIALAAAGVLAGIGIVAALRSSKPQARPQARIVARGAGKEDAGARAAGAGHGGCRITGIVTRDGKPLEGALVRVRLDAAPWASPDLAARAITAADGTFKLAGLRAGERYTVWAFLRGSATDAQSGVGCAENVPLELPPGAEMSLVFVPPKGVAPRAVELRIAAGSLWPPRTAVTGIDGRIVIAGLAPDDYSIWAAAEGGLAYVTREPLALAAGARDRFELPLETAGTARIRVEDAPDGRPVAAKVVAVPEGLPIVSRVAATDPGGVAVIDGLTAGAFQVSVAAAGYVSPSPIAVEAGDEATVRVERGGTVEGVVRDLDGRPVQGASIAVARDMGEAVADVPEGGRPFLARLGVAEQAGWPRASAVTDGVVALGPPSLPVPPGVADGSGAAGAPSWTSGADGRFVLTGLPSGEVSLGASKLGLVTVRQATINVETGRVSNGAEIVMREGLTVIVRTLNEAGFPIPGASVVAYDADGAEAGNGITARDGYVRLAGLPSSVRLEATIDGRVPAAGRLTSALGRTDTVELALPLADRVLRGRIVDARGYGVADVSITALCVTPRLSQVLVGKTADDGTFALEGAGPGDYHLVADTGAGQGAQTPFATAGTELKLVLERAPAGFAARVLGVASGPAELYPVETKKAARTPATASEIVIGPPIGEPPGDEVENLGSYDLPRPAAARPEPVDTESQAEPSSVETRFGQADNIDVTGPPPGKGGLPVSFAVKGGKLIAASVEPGSRVAAAGLLAGDRIVAVDGEPVRSPEAAQRAVNGIIGSVVMIDVERDGEHFAVVVQRVRVR